MPGRALRFQAIQKVAGEFLNPGYSNRRELAVEDGQAGWQEIGRDCWDRADYELTVLGCGHFLDFLLGVSQLPARWPRREVGFVLLCTGKARSALRIRT